MTESATSRTHGAEISERSTELVLPETPASANSDPLGERTGGVSDPHVGTGREAELTRAASGETRNASSESPEEARSTSVPPERRGLALPGDRGSESRAAPKQRPSFWRRIALGRRATKTQEETAPMNSPTPASTGPLVRARKSLVAATETPTQRGSAVTPSTDSIETRIVEPMLQALVSVESKLERSHVELVGRSDQVEQRLTQLWDIEEQLGALGELQDSLLQVAEQQRRLEATIADQNRTLRWVVGAVFSSLALAAFVVAAVLR